MTAGNTATCEIVGGHRPPLQLSKAYQNTYFKANCMILGSLTEVT
jgi:hypothetical protein